tara:strand:+ start:4664 stop:5161 length:498 start_codon:yes stop_codon:yes gene_type:complete
MKNLILTIAILVTGVINAQSFQKVKELRWANSESLTDLGFNKQAKKDSVYFKVLDFNQEANVWVNLNTKEVVKISKNATEYIYSDSVMIHARKWPVNTYVNITASLLRSIGHGFEISLFVRSQYVEEDEMDLAISARAYKKFRKYFLMRKLKVNDLCDNSFVVFY